MEVVLETDQSAQNTWQNHQVEQGKASRWGFRNGVLLFRQAEMISLNKVEANEGCLTDDVELIRCFI